MPVTKETLGRKFIKQSIIHITGPWGEEEMAAMHREVEAYNHANSFAHKAAAWKVVCQSVFAKAKLPSWDKWVRLSADERKWADDLPEDWPQFFPGFLRPGESVITGLALAKRLYDDIDHEVWWAAEILQSIESEEQAWARQDYAWAVSCGMQFGALTEQTRAKFSLEPAAMTGKALQEGRPVGTENSKQSRGETMRERQKAVRAMADELLKTGPDMTKDEVISSLRKEKTLAEILRDIKDASLRSDLKKPEEWSTVKSHWKKK
jgi:hypothetical protein